LGDRLGGEEQAAAALAHHRRDAPDKPAGTAYPIDGRNVTTLDGFYCVLGEAVNGRPSRVVVMPEFGIDLLPLWDRSFEGVAGDVFIGLCPQPSHDQ
jgi:hypothetical protein